MLSMFQYANLALSFVLELCMLAALGIWGYQAGEGWLRLILMIGAPLLAAIVWGLFAAPKAAIPISSVARLAVIMLLFGAAVGGLAVTHHLGWATALGAVFVLNMILAWAWHQ